MRNLFGQVCSGSTFSHDAQMETIASCRVLLHGEVSSGDTQIVTSSRDGSIESLESQDENPSRVGPPGAFPNTAPLKHNIQKVDPPAKRSRTHHLDAKQIYHTTDVGLQAPRNLRRTFETHLAQLKKGGNLLGESQAESIAVSDKASAKTPSKAGELLFEEIAEPGNFSGIEGCSQRCPETQTSLSDAAFESQSPHQPIAEKEAYTVQRRKEAYKAARETGKVWGENNRLLSSFEGRFEEELEL